MFGHEEAVCKMGAAFAHISRSQKRFSVVASEQCLGMFQRNSKGFLLRYVTLDETWIHYYTSETKNQSKMWTGSGESAPKKAKAVPSADKVRATIFWHSHVIISIDYLQKRIVNYVPRPIMWAITRRATMLAGDRSRGAISPASILSESRTYPNCVHWHIFYFM